MQWAVQILSNVHRAHKIRLKVDLIRIVAYVMLYKMFRPLIIFTDQIAKKNLNGMN